MADENRTWELQIDKRLREGRAGETMSALERFVETVEVVEESYRAEGKYDEMPSSDWSDLWDAYEVAREELGLPPHPEVREGDNG